MWMMQLGKITQVDLEMIVCQLWEMENKQNKKENWWGQSYLNNSY
jgi:hypothetical protein